MDFHHKRRAVSSLLLVTAVLLLLLLLSPSEVSASRRGGSHGGSGSSRRVRQCQALSRFSVSGVEPLTLTYGHVTLVALLTSTCSFCLSQASKLQNMSTSAGYADVRMMIINGGPSPQPGEQGPLERRVSFPVYHDDDSNTIWRQVFGGVKDDIFIIDRCGQLTYRIPFPYSFLDYNYVSRAIARTLTQNICPCQPGTQDPHDVMVGDPPYLGGSGIRRGQGYGRNQQRRPGSSGGHHNLANPGCPRHDKLCSEMQIAGRRYRGYLRGHRLHPQPDMPEQEALDLFQRSQVGTAMVPAF